jgi:hypothetical protein
VIEPETDQENDEDRQMMLFLQSPEGTVVLERLREPDLEEGVGRVDDTPPRESRYERMFFRDRDE